mmetsp:Transcript_31885/g.74566  ORF Transcript_31885/g.74566 Transcript_31885/m.74566 type:complete len:266 (-) Transcript_31885:556-1353(-)
MAHTEVLRRFRWPTWLVSPVPSAPSCSSAPLSSSACKPCLCNCSNWRLLFLRKLRIILALLLRVMVSFNRVSRGLSPLGASPADNWRPPCSADCSPPREVTLPPASHCWPPSLMFVGRRLSGGKFVPVLLGAFFVAGVVASPGLSCCSASCARTSARSALSISLSRSECFRAFRLPALPNALALSHRCNAVRRKRSRRSAKASSSSSPRQMARASSVGSMSPSSSPAAMSRPTRVSLDAEGFIRGSPLASFQVTPRGLANSLVEG